MLKKIKKTSKLPISHIIITHSHPDHFLGTEALIADNPIIIGHENLNRSLINNFDFYKALQFNLTKDESLKTTNLILANKFVKKNQTLKINLGGRNLIIRAWSSGHTDNDLSIYDENSKIFWSENIFVDRIPSIRASILGWRKNLSEIQKLDINKIVPGHGPVSYLNDVIAFKNILQEHYEITEDGFEEGLSVKQIMAEIKTELNGPGNINKEEFINNIIYDLKTN